ncbi:hypothetical protein EBB07_05520 [Paenibacillaceae bacterium]|nr:hypothetical protein EBB07_05520 [Paenibacillaceae bacterium]
MMDKVKTTVLVVLVALSLLQSYFLAYSFPSLSKTISSEQDYVQTEKMGPEEKVENVIFPMDMILHFGNGKHTLLYPGTEFYDRIFDKLKSREFKGFQRNSLNAFNWNEVRNSNTGVELRFDNGMPVELLQKVLKLEGDLQFMEDTIDRIWIFRMEEREEVKVYFFSSDGDTAYESMRADLTISDVQEYVGFGAYLTPYSTADGRLYLPDKPLQAVEVTVGFNTYTPEQMQRNLFFNAGSTRAIEDRSGTQIYTDGKRGLEVEQGGQWVRYTNPVSSASSPNNLSDNVYAAIQFVNDHGGWDGTHHFVNPGELERGRLVVFRQYFNSLPIVSYPSFRFGDMRLVLQQGVIAEYERSLVTLGELADTKVVRYLPGGKALEDALANYDRRVEVKTLFPALESSLASEEEIRLTPVWAVRLRDGTIETLMRALPAGTVIPDDAVPAANDLTEEAGRGEENDADNVEGDRETGGNTASNGTIGGNTISRTDQNAADSEDQALDSDAATGPNTDLILDTGEEDEANADLVRDAEASPDDGAPNPEQDQDQGLPSKPADKSNEESSANADAGESGHEDQAGNGSLDL